MTVLVISDTPWIFGNVKQVSTGAAPAITSDAGFTAARAKAPTTRNLMLFVSPKLITQAPKEMGLANQWAVADLTIRDGGIPFNATGTVDTKTADFYRHLPKPNPFAATSSKCCHLAHTECCDLAAREYLRDDRGRDACRPEFRFESDGRHGEGHPRRTQHEPSRRHPSRVQGRYGRRRLSCRGGLDAGFDVLVLVDDSNGSDPAAIAAKVQEWVGKKMSEDKDAPKGPLFDKSEKDGVTFYHLGGEMQKQLQDGLGQGAEHSVIKKNAMVDNKTVAWATIGKNGIGRLVRKACSIEPSTRTRRKRRSLMRNSPNAAPQVFDGSQNLVIFNLGRIADGVSNTMNPSNMEAKTKDMMDSVVGAFKSLIDPCISRPRSAKTEPLTPASLSRSTTTN